MGRFDLFRYYLIMVENVYNKQAVYQLGNVREPNESEKARNILLQLVSVKEIEVFFLWEAAYDTCSNTYADDPAYELMPIFAQKLETFGNRAI